MTVRRASDARASNFLSPGRITGRYALTDAPLTENKRCRGERPDLVGQVKYCSPRVISISPTESRGYASRGVFGRRHHPNTHDSNEHHAGGR